MWERQACINWSMPPQWPLEVQQQAGHADCRACAPDAPPPVQLCTKRSTLRALPAGGTPAAAAEPPLSLLRLPLSVLLRQEEGALGVAAPPVLLLLPLWTPAASCLPAIGCAAASVALAATGPAAGHAALPAVAGTGVAGSACIADVAGVCSSSAGPLAASAAAGGAWPPAAGVASPSALAAVVALTEGASGIAAPMLARGVAGSGAATSGWAPRGTSAPPAES